MDVGETGWLRPSTLGQEGTDHVRFASDSLVICLCPSFCLKPEGLCCVWIVEDHPITCSCCQSL